MLTRLALTGALSLLFAGATLAQTVDNPEECLASAFELAESAEQKELPELQFKKIEELLTKIEDHCDANQYSEAMAVAQDLRAMIEKL